MAALSDLLLVVAILGYTAAMLAYAAEYAFGNRGAVARIAVRQPELVGVGGPDAASEDPVPTPLDRPAGGSRGDAGPPRAVAVSGRAAAALTALAWLAHAACLVTRGLAAHRVPWGNMYEFVLAVTLVGATTWLVLVLRRPNLRPLGLSVALVLVILLGIDGMRLYTEPAPLVPALNSYWLKIHVTAAVTASGTFMVGFVTAAMTLIRAGHDAGKTRFPYPPSATGSRPPTAWRGSHSASTSSPSRSGPSP